MRRQRDPSRGRSAALRDLLLILAAVFALVGLGTASGLFDRVYRWIDQRFAEHLGSAIAVLMLVAIGLGSFAFLQWRTARREFRARRDAESRFRTLVERVPAVTYAWDSSKHAGETPVAYMSPQIEALLGYPAEEFQRDPKLWSSLVHPRIWTGSTGTGRPPTNETTRSLSEYRMLTRDGREVWVRDEAVPFSREDKNPMLQGVMFDITERKRAEERLLEAEERFRSLVEQVPAITYIAELDGGYRYVSPQIEAMLGYTAQEWISDPSMWEQALHVEDRERVLSEDRTDVDIWSSVHRMVGRDGRVLWVQNHAMLLRGLDGRPRYWQGVVFDITELKTAEVRIAEAESNYRTLVEQLPAVVYRDAIDDVSTAIYISPQYEQLFGYSPRKHGCAIPSSGCNHLHPDDRERIVELSRWTNETGEPFSAEYRFLAREGREVWVRDEAVLLRDADGEPLLWQGVLFDITARKHAEESLSRRDAVLEAIGFAAERFLKSHDWVVRVGRRARTDRDRRPGPTAPTSSRTARWRTGVSRCGCAASGSRRGSTSIDDPATTGLPYADGFIRWQAVLSRGMELHGLTRDFPEAERTALQAEGVLSQIVVPVFVGDEWWGYLGFDDCVVERIWAPAEVEAL